METEQIIRSIVKVIGVPEIKVAYTLCSTPEHYLSLSCLIGAAATDEISLKQMVYLFVVTSKEFKDKEDITKYSHMFVHAIANALGLKENIETNPAIEAKAKDTVTCANECYPYLELLAYLKEELGVNLSSWKEACKNKDFEMLYQAFKQGQSLESLKDMMNGVVTFSFEDEVIEKNDVSLGDPWEDELSESIEIEETVSNLDNKTDQKEPESPWIWLLGE